MPSARPASTTVAAEDRAPALTPGPGAQPSPLRCASCGAHLHPGEPDDLAVVTAEDEHGRRHVCVPTIARVRPRRQARRMRPAPMEPTVSDPAAVTGDPPPVLR